jgi:hypothetical protein
MRRKPSASHCVKNESLLTYRPISLVFLAGAQVVKISRSKARVAFRQVFQHQLAAVHLELRPWPLTSTRARFSSSPSRRSGWAATSGLRRRRILLSTRVLAGSRSKVRSTVSIQKAGAW